MQKGDPDTPGSSDRDLRAFASRGTMEMTEAHSQLAAAGLITFLHPGRKRPDIRPEDLSKFQHARLINAMIRFEDALDINILNICA